MCMGVTSMTGPLRGQKKASDSLTPGVVESCTHHAAAKDLTCILCKSSWWSLSHCFSHNFFLKNAKGYSNVTFFGNFLQDICEDKRNLCVNHLQNFIDLLAHQALSEGSESSGLFSKHVFPEWISQVHQNMICVVSLGSSKFCIHKWIEDSVYSH